ncbi:MAG: N-acetylmuramoyl-L-alanine amidase [Phycisphaerae bacterium]|nr:N-acetylmuramoyl-L-alanine amidase [Phycisphaerae bacterium]
MSTQSDGNWPVSRRAVLLGGSALAAAWVGGVGGCQSSSRSGAASGAPADPLPGPIAQEPLRPMPNLRPAPAPPPTPSGQITIVPRSAWTREGAVVARTKPLRAITRLTVHHEGSTVFNSTNDADVAKRLATIRAAHLQRRARRTGENWADIGYHYIIDPAGRVWEGRSTQYQGAHVDENNEENLGIMVLGNFDRQTPTRAQFATLDLFVADRLRLYRIPVTRVYTHQELDRTACPGSGLQRYMLATRRPGGGLRTMTA